MDFWLVRKEGGLESLEGSGNQVIGLVEDYYVITKKSNVRIGPGFMPGFNDKSLTKEFKSFVEKTKKSMKVPLSEVPLFAHGQGLDVLAHDRLKAGV